MNEQKPNISHTKVQVNLGANPLSRPLAFLDAHSRLIVWSLFFGSVLAFGVFLLMVIGGWLSTFLAWAL